MKKFILFLVLLGIAAIIFNLLEIVAGFVLLIIGAVALALALILWLVNKAGSSGE